MSKMDTWFRKHDPRNPKDPSGLFLFRNGHPVVVLRPKDAAVKMAAINLIPDGTPHEIAAKAFDEALNSQPHQFVGYAGRGAQGSILDKWGKKVGDIMAGDSLCGGPQFEPPMFMQSGHFHKEVWDGRTVMVLPRPDLKADSNTGIVLECSDPSERAAIVIRPGGGTEVDCHLPTINRLITGDPERHYLNGPAPKECPC